MIWNSLAREGGEGAATKWEERGLDIKLCDRGRARSSKWEQTLWQGAEEREQSWYITS